MIAIRRRMFWGGTIGAAMLTPMAAGHAQPVTAVAELAPTGRLRAAINTGNAVLARRDPAGGLGGISVDIAHELGRRLKLPVDLVAFDEAGKVSAAAGQNVWDVAFLARDPERAEKISFTAAYVVIEGSYVVRQESPLTAVDQVDRDGIRIAVAAKSAYDLFLSRSLRHAELVRAANGAEAVALFRSDRLQVIAGVKQALLQLEASDPTLRLIPGAFMEIDQAMGTPSGRPTGAAWLHDFVEDIKSSGFVAEALKRNGQTDVTVAPPG